MTTAEIAAILAAVILAVLVLFQLALALGAPLGHFAWGGAVRVLPAGLRAASFVGAIVYVAVALVLLDQAGLVDIIDDGLSRTASWVIVGLFALGTVMNLASRSPSERVVMTPVALALATLAFMVVRG